MKTHFTRLTALLCAAAILLCSLPMQALAADFQPQTTYEDSLLDELPVQDEPAVPEEPEPSEEPELPEQPEADADASAEPEAAPEEPAVSVLSTGNKSGDFTYSVLSDNTAQITGYSGTTSNLTIPSELDGYAVCSIGSKAFDSKTSLNAVTFPEGLTYIDVYAFQHCTRLQEIKFPSTLAAIYGSAFYACSVLSEVELPDSVQTLGANAFGGCTALRTANYPKAWKNVPCDTGFSPSGYYYSPFASCAKLTSITVPEGVTAIPNYAFRNSCIESVFFPSTLSSIGTYAFDSCKNLTSVVFPEGLTYIDVYAFQYCTALKEVKFPSTLTAIYGTAFYKCTSLEEIQLPDSIQTLGADAFGSCTALRAANYPKSWKSVSYNTGFSPSGYYYSPFASCAKLTSITVPEGVTAIPGYAFERSCIETISFPGTLTSIGRYAFDSCKSLTSIVFPEGLTYIDVYAFQYCTALKEVKFPSTLTAIYGTAFYKCTSLEEIQLPDSIQTLGADVFGSCTALMTANYPKSWNNVSYDTGFSPSGYRYSPFRGCTKLISIAVPEGVTVIPNYAFKSSSLESISLPSTLTSVGAYAFMGCQNLAYVEPVDGLQSIGREAFSGCTGLKLFHLTDSVTSFGQNIFYNCKNLTVECAQHSFAAIYCIDSGLPVHLLAGFTDRDSYRLSRDRTYYIANTVSALASGLISMNLEYGYKPGMESGVTNQSLTIRLPSSAKLLERTLRLNGAVLTSYTLQDTLLTIPLTEMSGRLSFSLQPTGSGSLTTYAVMNYQQGGSSKREVVGVLNDTLSTLTVYADETVNTAQVTVSGVGPAGADVELSVNGSFACIAHCSKGGTYRTTILLPDPQEYAPYVISAKSASSSGEALTASCEVTYAPAAPALQNFTMDYNGKTYDVLSLGKKKPVVTFAGKPFFFSIQFSNPEQIDRVYVCSSRSNVVKRMEAVWNESTGCYEANGWFDPNNHNYVPGTITVQYSQRKEPLNFKTGVDFTAPKYVNGTSEQLRAAIRSTTREDIEITAQTENEFSGSIKVKAAAVLVGYEFVSENLTAYTEVQQALADGFAPIKDDFGQTIYMKILDSKPDAVEGTILDFASGKEVEYRIIGSYTASDAIASFSSFIEAFDYVDTLITWDNNRVSLSEARQSVLSSSMSEQQKADALFKLDTASKANNGVVAAASLTLILAAAGIALPFPCSMILPLLSLQKSMYTNGILSEFGFLNASESAGAMFNFRWNIDPSGYVYDAETMEPLPGVKTTLYCIEKPAGVDDSFFETAPDAAQTGTLWDASEWDQDNPLTTDEDGFYAWEVPEGWWRVKYELDGYETAWSDWLPVPPPQTDVNIGLKPLAPEYTVRAETVTAEHVSVRVTSDGAAKQTARCVLAAYDADGRLTATAVQTLSPGSSVVLTLSGLPADGTVKLFLLNSTTGVPLRRSWSATLQAA